MVILEYLGVLLLAVGKAVCMVLAFATSAYFGGYLFRKGWDAAGKLNDCAVMLDGAVK